ncbi:glycosyltransferase [Nocardioides flavescens]|uniref:Glycosyltransferase n=1 Tax=Nocardioides flavescens TaxID=2691959 RepID=A0A6L7F0B0_9ACTN|nr:glycosyltransferase [Nocardioides flavescens]
MSAPFAGTAVILAYGHQPLLPRAVEAVLASRGIDVDVVLVDNGGEDDVVRTLAELPGVEVVRPGSNLGFAAGCNLGAHRARGEHLLFVNGDAVVEPDALARLVAALDDRVALASASVRLLDRPDVMNSAGNPVHFLGISWAGALGEPAADHSTPSDITSISGATAAVRRDDFLAMGGFCETLFTYVEDTDLSLRSWSRGRRAVFVPDAVVHHDYEFSRNPDKFYLLERNRLFMVLTLYPARVLLAVLPVLVAAELALLGLAAKQGWASQKLRGWWWLLRHVPEIRRRRRAEARDRVISDSAFAALLTPTLDPGVDGFALPRGVQFLTTSWWIAARRGLRLVSPRGQALQ